MGNIFLDIDNTLIRWEIASNNKEVPFVNGELVEAIYHYMVTNPKTKLFIWSGGGTEYAKKFAENVFINFQVVPKYITIPQEDDICIDDSEVVTKGVTMTPEQFIEKFQQCI